MEGISNRMISPCADTFWKSNVFNKAQWFTQCSNAVSRYLTSKNSFNGNNFKQMNNCSSIGVSMKTSTENICNEVPNLRRYYTQ